MATQLTPNLIAVTVPDGANSFMISWAQGECDLICYVGTVIKHLTTLPATIIEGKRHDPYRILGIAREVKEGEWKGFVERVEYFHIAYKSYEDEVKEFKTATEAGHSLLRSKGLDMNVLLIEKLG